MRTNLLDHEIHAKLHQMSYFISEFLKTFSSVCHIFLTNF
jgi:hypothetical protein